MSLEPIKISIKRNDIKTGVHLVSINDLYYLRNAAKEIIKTHEGYPTIVVQFKKSKEELHEKYYIIDKGSRQKYFDNMLRIAQVNTTNGAPNKADIIGKKLWIAVQEIHYVNDDKVVLEDDNSGQAKIDYHIFKVYPYIESGRKPTIKGDPENNDGIATDDFVTYKNISTNPIREEIKTEVPLSRLNEPIGVIKPDKKPKTEEPKFEK